MLHRSRNELECDHGASGQRIRFDPLQRYVCQVLEPAHCVQTARFTSSQIPILHALGPVELTIGKHLRTYPLGPSNSRRLFAAWS